MGTRSIWTFKDTHKWKDPKTGRPRIQQNDYHVYKHWDGYPEGAALILAKTVLLGRVWGLPRFEADEFAAGLVATNKDSGGDFRLSMNRYGHVDVEYGYTIWFDIALMVQAVQTHYWDAEDVWTGKGTTEKPVYEGTVWGFLLKFGDYAYGPPDDRKVALLSDRLKGDSELGPMLEAVEPMSMLETLLT